MQPILWCWSPVQAKEIKIIQIEKSRFVFSLNNYKAIIHEPIFPHFFSFNLFISEAIFTKYHCTYNQCIHLPWSSFGYIWNFHSNLLKLHYLVFKASLSKEKNCIYILVMNDPSLIYSDSFLGRHWKLQAVWVQCTEHDFKEFSFPHILTQHFPLVLKIAEHLHMGEANCLQDLMVPNQYKFYHL